MPRRERPPTEEEEEEGASARDVLERVVPLVVKVATDSASATTAVGASLASLEKKGDTHALTTKERFDAVDRELKEISKKFSELKKVDAASSRAWLSFLKNIFTPANVTQMLLIIGAALGLWTQMPNGDQDQDDREDGVEVPKHPPE